VKFPTSNYDTNKDTKNSYLKTDCYGVSSGTFRRYGVRIYKLGKFKFPLYRAVFRALAAHIPEYHERAVVRSAKEPHATVRSGCGSDDPI